jgi:iron complex transport system substrate-binding protein
MIATLGALVGAQDKAAALIAELESTIGRVKQSAANLPRRPRVYFEEWNEPLITGIRWASELIEIAGGEDCFAELARYPSAKDRILANSDAVLERMPDIVIGSWCGKKFQPEQVVARPGWSAIPAVRDNMVFEIKSANILQPGPSAITYGLKQMQAIIQQWGARQT